MIVHHARGLHEGVTDGRADKPETAFFQVAAHRIRLGRRRWNFADAAPLILERLAVHEPPDVTIEAAEFLLDREERPGVGNNGFDLEPVAHDPGLVEQRGRLLSPEPCDLRRVETGEHGPVVLALAKDGVPAQSRLCAFEREELEPPAIIALGLVHQLWSPIPREFDDYIARPKSNQYRSLHTAVVGPEGKAIEVQIRTHEMHQHSELGIAAHWRYKEGARHDPGYDEKIAWLRQILEWRDDVHDAGELVEQFRTGLFDDVVYVLTPQGKVIALPKGSTPIDFAYHVHTELGHRCRGARVDDIMVPLNTPLANGQRVEIVAAKQGGPSRDWLNAQLGYLRSAGARTKVRQWFNPQKNEAAVAQGRALLDQELQRHGNSALNLDKVAADAGYAKLNDFLADLGNGKIGAKQLAIALRPAAVPEPPAEKTLVTHRARGTVRDSILIVGVDKLLTAPARCCKPVPPDPIVGFVTRGRGVSVHRAGCANVKRLDPKRRVPAEWGPAEGVTFPVEIEVEAIDRTGLLRDISDVLSRERINVTATNSLSSNLAARMRFTLEVSDAAQLKRVLAMIREVRGVMSAVRR